MIELQLLLASFSAWASRRQRTIAEYVAPHDRERSRQGPGNEIPSRVPVQREGGIVVNERIGGELKYYHRVAAREGTTVSDRVFGHYGVAV